MKTLSIISHKGGAGKTSSAVMLAEALARRGARVVLIDADRQRGAGLLLGIDQPTGTVQQTGDSRLRYFCSSTLPLRDLPARAQELDGLFDIGVVDTPSLDDPLARAWIQLSSDALMVVPVEPVSIRTLDAAEAALNGIRKLNPQIQCLGILPTLFEEGDANQRSLMMELMSQRGDQVLTPSIPYDPGMAHRAEQKEDRRTEASEACFAAYAAIAEQLAGLLDPEPAAVAVAAAPAPPKKGTPPWRAIGGGGRGAAAPAPAPPAAALPTRPQPVRPGAAAGQAAGQAPPAPGRGARAAAPQAARAQPISGRGRVAAPAAAAPAPAAVAAPGQRDAATAARIEILKWILMLVLAVAFLFLSMGYFIGQTRGGAPPAQPAPKPRAAVKPGAGQKPAAKKPVQAAKPGAAGQPAKNR